MKHFILLLLFSAGLLWAAQPDPAAILKAIDANMTASSAKSVTRMVIHGKRSSRTVESINWSQGRDKFYTEYTAPPREKGTKMLKVGDNLWIYDPGTDRTIQISGNMLKQSVMGSDLSYEDFMEDTSLEEDYAAVIDKDATYEGRECWVMTLTAKKPGLAYQTCKLHVDKERNVILYEQLYAKSGKLLKSVAYSDVAKTSSRWYPRRVLFKDELKEGKGTEYFVDSIEFDVSIPAATFTKAMLKK
ncbi:MAG: outer membrane lipoprotein-sorting protein [Candidatus Syntrophosphaera sp.]|nr:outer membrane lipoprotein-sorting protein [Candidatus Syntrophosphaera sp.]